MACYRDLRGILQRKWQTGKAHDARYLSVFIKYMEAEPGIEPRYTALQADDVSFFAFHINRLQTLSGNPLRQPTLGR